MLSILLTLSMHALESYSGHSVCLFVGLSVGLSVDSGP